MRQPYETRLFDFEASPAAQVPRRIILHRQGNPGVEGENGLAWGKRTGAFTIHSYIDDAVCFDAIAPLRHAFHVKEASVAAARGFRTAGAYGPRGDYDSIGIETEDENAQSTALAPGQAYGLSQETRVTLLLRVAAYLRQFPPLTPDDVTEHADWDRWQRPEDLGDALNIPDFRDDLRDLLAGREPWRTVGAFARGGRTTVLPPAAPPTVAPPLGGINGYLAGLGLLGRRVEAVEQTDSLRWRYLLTVPRKE